MDEETLGKLMDSICEATAEAVKRYAEIAATDPVGNMPEHFISSLVFEKIGSELAGKGTALGLEVSVKKLRAYNAAAKTDHAASGILTQLPDQLADSTVPGYGNSDYEKIDMVVFESDISNTRRGLLALIEFKFGFGNPWLRDRDKLLRILSELDTCQWGIFCAEVGHGLNTAWLDKEEEHAKKRGDLWRRTSVNVLPVKGKYPAHSVCALGFQRRHAEASP
jgi:hypothetical protein